MTETGHVDNPSKSQVLEDRPPLRRSTGASPYVRRSAEECKTLMASHYHFWQWFDGLPKEERDRMNNAKNPPEVEEWFDRAVQLYPPKF